MKRSREQHATVATRCTWECKRISWFSCQALCIVYGLKVNILHLCAERRCTTVYTALITQPTLYSAPNIACGGYR